MRPERTPRYGFRAVEEDDLPLLAGWFGQPHVSEWWDGGADEQIGEIAAAMDDVAIEPLIVELDGRPIGYIQSYDPHLEDDHPYQDQPFGTLGIDQFIGPPGLVGIGHGPAFIRQFGAPRVVTDPDPRNARAIRAYEKAGFTRLGERDTPFGRVLLMARDAENEE